MTIFVLRNGSWSCKDLAWWFIGLVYFLAQILAQWLNPENQPLLSDNCCGIRLQFCRLAWQISPNSSFNETLEILRVETISHFSVSTHKLVFRIFKVREYQAKTNSWGSRPAPGVGMMWSLISLASVMSSSDIQKNISSCEHLPNINIMPSGLGRYF